MIHRLNLHLVGLKGVPATYGGVERAVEEVGARLAARGHRVVSAQQSSQRGPAAQVVAGVDEHLSRPAEPPRPLDGVPATGEPEQELPL